MERGRQNVHASRNSSSGELEGGVTQHPSLHESSFKGKEVNYTMVVDRNHYIWMVGGQGIDKIWRGRVNKLGFLIQ